MIRNGQMDAMNFREYVRIHIYIYMIIYADVAGCKCWLSYDWGKNLGKLQEHYWTSLISQHIVSFIQIVYLFAVQDGIMGCMMYDTMY